MGEEEAHRQMESASLFQELFYHSFQKEQWTNQALRRGPHLNITKIFLKIYSYLVGYTFLGMYPFILGWPICWHIIAHNSPL